MARPVGLGPTLYSLGGCCLIHLGYGRIKNGRGKQSRTVVFIFKVEVSVPAITTPFFNRGNTEKREVCQLISPSRYKRPIIFCIIVLDEVSLLPSLSREICGSVPTDCAAQGATLHRDLVARRKLTPFFRKTRLIFTYYSCSVKHFFEQPEAF